MKAIATNVQETDVQLPVSNHLKKRYPSKPQPEQQEIVTATEEMNHGIAVKFMRFIFDELKHTVHGKTVLKMKATSNTVSFVFTNKRYCITLGIKEIEGAEA